jgi:hypothetical protein
MDTGRSISFTSLRQVNDRLFNHSVHLSSPATRTWARRTSALLASGASPKSHPNARIKANATRAAAALIAR